MKATTNRAMTDSSEQGAAAAVMRRIRRQGPTPARMVEIGKPRRVIDVPDREPVRVPEPDVVPSTPVPVPEPVVAP